MFVRVTLDMVLGAAAFVVVSASPIFAQGSPPASERRIPLTKQSAPGEVALTRVDTLTVYRTDTVRITTQLPGRIDTLRMTVTRLDTVVAPPPPPKFPNGLYLGVAAGAGAPDGSIYVPNSTGGTAQAQLGWQGAKNVIGGRIDVNYARPGKDSRFANLQDNPNIVNISLDLKVQLPWLPHLMGAEHRFAIYGIGGYSYTSFQNLPIRLRETGPHGETLVQPGSADWRGFNAWNAGGGLSLGWGRTQLFLESRVFGFTPEHAPQARLVPVVFGINFF